MTAAAASSKLPPMLQQYLDYQEQYPDCILLFQVGDFYEAFFEHAITVSKTLNLTLTSRDKKAEDPIPMCGVPIAVVDNYAKRLVDANFSVALVSQVSSSNGRGAVERKLERIITPGVQILGSGENAEDGLIAALYYNDLHDISLAYCQPASAKVSVLQDLDQQSMLFQLSRLMPSEVVLPQSIDGVKLDRRAGLVRELERVLKTPNIRFRNEDSSFLRAKRREFNATLGYGELSPQTRTAVRLLVSYLDEVTVDTGLHISAIVAQSESDVLLIDSSTRENLELVKNVKTGTKEGSLYSYLDETSTVGGSRCLKRWILSPSTDIQDIKQRQVAVHDFLEGGELLENLGKSFKYVCDLERAAARIELDVISPRELAVVRDSLLQAKQIALQLEGSGKSGLQTYIKGLTVPDALLKILTSALSKLPPLNLKEGGVFREGYNAELDRLAGLRLNSKQFISELEEREREATGITSLKVKFNNVHNYFFEVTKANLSKVPECYIKKQSTVNYERFYTPELKRLEEDFLSAESKQITLEASLFQELKSEVKPYVAELRELYSRLSVVDVLTAFAEVALKNRLVCPDVNDTKQLLIQSGRHPILAKSLQEDFVPNDISLNSASSNTIVLTGPNMGGKSTYLRQTGLILIMAQIGSFVPVESAEIGIIDRLFARIGASDDQAEGSSTFMVEMQEAAEIVANATAKSLILIDELGRGTSTTDGLALAQSILEWIAEQTKARMLFATHFYSLTKLADKYSAITNFSVGSVDLDGQVVFTHEICSGPANNSYGLEVAKLAGLPNEIISRAVEIVATAPKGQEGEIIHQMSLFNTKAQNQKPKEFCKKVQGLDVDNFTPREALNQLYALVEEAKLADEN